MYFRQQFHSFQRKKSNKFIRIVIQHGAQRHGGLSKERMNSLRWMKAPLKKNKEISCGALYIKERKGVNRVPWKSLKSQFDRIFIIWKCKSTFFLFKKCISFFGASIEILYWIASYVRSSNNNNKGASRFSRKKTEMIRLVFRSFVHWNGIKRRQQ